MFDLLFATSIVGSCIEVIKGFFEKEIPAENWANEELYYEDLKNGVPIEERMKNLEKGKYKLEKKHTEPHRDSVSGKIIIENCLLYDEDLMKHGAVQTMKWVKQGKYNLNEEELKKENERIKNKYRDLYNLYK